MSIRNGRLTGYSPEETKEIMKGVCLSRIAGSIGRQRITLCVPVKDGEIDLPTLRRLNAEKVANNMRDTEASHE